MRRIYRSFTHRHKMFLSFLIALPTGLIIGTIVGYNGGYKQGYNLFRSRYDAYQTCVTHGGHLLEKQPSSCLDPEGKEFIAPY